MRQAAKSAVILLLLLFPLTVFAWQEDPALKEIGSVSSWMDLDSRFYRIFGENPYQDQSQFRLNQIKAYNESKVINGGRPSQVALDQFLALPESDRNNRRKEALQELDKVVRFRNFQLQRLQQARENSPTESLMPTRDQTYLTDSLRHLNTAVSVDPSNYYAWHLLAYFADCCGDRVRARSALLATQEALKTIPEDQNLDIRQRVQLDLAWLDRNQGQFEAAGGHLDQADKLGKRSVESHLLRGLIAAQTGDANTALELASALRSQEVKIYPVDYETVGVRPDMVDVQTWVTKKSDYLQAWIIALLEIQKGDLVAAGRAFREYPHYRYYPFAPQFWNDAGLIYERTGRAGLANKAWATAGLSRPWFMYMAYKPYGIRLGELTGSGAPAAFYLGFDQFYLAGSRLAHGASLVGQMAAMEDPVEKQSMAVKALDQLEICQKTGQYPGQASILQGQAYFLLGDYQGSVAELKQAQGFFEKEGDSANLASVMQDMAIIQQELDASGVTKFYSQSGRSKGRWDADLDPEAREDDLVARLEADTENNDLRLELARHYIRNGKVAEGRQLAFSVYNPNQINEETYQVVTLVLEADRQLGEEDMADAMLRQLAKGKEDKWTDAGVWALVSAICQDNGRPEDARSALEVALKMDPDNQGIRNMLRMME